MALRRPRIDCRPLPCAVPSNGPHRVGDARAERRFRSHPETKCWGPPRPSGLQQRILLSILLRRFAPPGASPPQGAAASQRAWRWAPRQTAWLGAAGQRLLRRFRGLGLVHSPIDSGGLAVAPCWRRWQLHCPLASRPPTSALLPQVPFEAPACAAFEGMLPSQHTQRVHLMHSRCLTTVF